MLHLKQQTNIRWEKYTLLVGNTGFLIEAASVPQRERKAKLSFLITI